MKRSDTLLVVGASARAAAASARRAGWRVASADLFADRDLRGFADARRAPSAGYPDTLRAAAAHAPAEAPLLITGGLEHAPGLLRVLMARHAPLFGDDSSTVARAAAPETLRTACAGAPSGIREPRPRPDAPRLTKPGAGTGGQGVRGLAPGEAAPRGAVVQRYVAGTPMAAVFRGDTLLGVTRQRVGPAPGQPRPFAYRGSVGPVALSRAEEEALAGLGARFARESGIRGVYGIDLVRDEWGVLHPVEVNPRYPASAEILERAGAPPVLASTSGAPFDGFVHGKEIVFAESARRAPDLTDLGSADRAADIPDPGTMIPEGAPICTVFAEAEEAGACGRRLESRVAEVGTRMARC